MSHGNTDKHPGHQSAGKPARMYGEKSLLYVNIIGDRLLGSVDSFFLIIKKGLKGAFAL